VNRVEYWSPERWVQPAKPAPTVQPGASRADLVFALAQYLADAAADAEGRPRRPVPRLTPDTHLPDQLRVLATDLLLASATEASLTEAADAVRATTRSL